MGKKYPQEKWDEVEKLQRQKVKIEDIAAQTGISRAMVYRHFSPEMAQPRVTLRKKAKKAPDTSP